MEINKKLFEDVLSDKLKGKFVLRNESIISSNWLRRAQQNKVIAARPHPYILEGKYYCYYTENGQYIDDYVYHNLDIIDFIPNTDMKENELTIEIPDGKIVDWDESKKQNKIVLKDKQLTYRDICRKLFHDEAFYYIKPDGSLGSAFVNGYTPTCGKTRHQLECILAKNQLANAAVYLNNGWKPDLSNFGYFICVCNKELEILERGSYKFSNNIIFKSKELAQQAIEILGEETIKLALEPLGI